MNIEIVRTDRKTIGLAVQDPDTLVVRAPRGVGDAHIEAVLAARKEWIDAAARKMAQRAALIADIRAEAGGVMLLDGVRHAVVRRAPHGEQSEGSVRLIKAGPMRRYAGRCCPFCISAPKARSCRSPARWPGTGRGRWDGCASGAKSGAGGAVRRGGTCRSIVRPCARPPSCSAICWST